MLNADKTQNWKNDTLDSIDYYNDWFLRFAPLTYREQRKVKKDEVERAFVVTEYLRKLTIEVMVKHPEILSVLDYVPARVDHRSGGSVGVSVMGS